MSQWRVWVGMAGIVLTPLSLVGLGACVGSTMATEAPAAGVSVVGDQVALGGARAFAVAELTYITAADGAGRLVRAGFIRGATASRLRVWNRQARQMLVAGRGTIDAAEKAQLAADLFGVSDHIFAVSGKR